MRPVGLRLRIVLATTAVLTGLLVLTHGVMRGLVGRILAREIEAALERARRAHDSFAEMRTLVLLDQARSVAQVPHLRAVLDTPDVDEETVSYTLSTLGAALGAERLFVWDAAGAPLADTRGLTRDITEHELVASAVAGRAATGIAESAGSAWLVATAPVTLEGACLGVAGVGYPLERHAQDLRRVTGLDVTLLRGERQLAAAWSEAAGELADSERATLARLGTSASARVVLANRECMATAVPLAERGLQLVLSRPIDDVLEPFRRARQDLLALGLLIAALGLGVSLWVAERIAEPVRALTRAARALARGEPHAEVDARSDDEVGQLAQAFNDMARQLSTLMSATLAKARAAEQASEAKSVFLATMSHEIRTPLNGVLGFAEQLRATELDADQAAFVDTIRSSGEILLALIDEVLDFARLEAGELLLEQTEFRLGSCLARALDPLRPALAAKGLSLGLDIAPDVPETLVGPGSRVRQLVTNYASNAVKFTARGGVAVRAAARPAGEDEVELRVEVADTGIGIAPEEIGRLFRPFAQIDSGADRAYGGTGLGLAICKELAALMGGTVGVESEVGRGSTFWFTARLRKAGTRAAADPPIAPLPARVLEAHPSTVAWLPDAAARERRGTKRILAAEDNRVNQRVLAALLARAGWQHELVANGLEAVSAFAARSFDLVLMDCQMPVLDGLAATRRIRQLPGGERVPIVALTANAFASDREACRAAGMDDFVAKPFDAAALVALIDRLLARGVAAEPSVVPSTDPDGR